jgi:hypothetical protein
MSSAKKGRATSRPVRKKQSLVVDPVSSPSAASEQPAPIPVEADPSPLPRDPTPTQIEVKMPALSIPAKRESEEGQPKSAKGVTSRGVSNACFEPQKCFIGAVENFCVIPRSFPE